MTEEKLEANRAEMKHIFQSDLKELGYYAWTIMRKFRQGADKSELSDIMNDSFIKCYFLLADPRYEKIYNMEGWIRRVLQFETLSYLKKKRKVSIDIDSMNQYMLLLDRMTYSTGDSIDANATIEL